MKFRSRTSGEFWRLYDKLPAGVQRQADKQYEVFAANPTHPSLQLKPIGPLWSVRVSLSHRALAIRKGDVFHWLWIGTHDEYEQILKQL